MSIYSGYVASSDKDWDETNGSTDLALTFTRTNDAIGDPLNDKYAYAVLDTGFLVGSTITAATFYWKHSTPDSSKPMLVSLWNGTSFTTQLYVGLGGAAGAWKSTGTTLPAHLNCINASAGTQTTMVFVSTISSPSVTRTLKAVSYDTAQLQAPYVVVSYIPAETSSARRRIFIID